MCIDQFQEEKIYIHFVRINSVSISIHRYNAFERKKLLNLPFLIIHLHSKREEVRKKNHKYPVINLHHRFQSQKVKSTENQFQYHLNVSTRQKHISEHVYTVYTHTAA